MYTLFSGIHRVYMVFILSLIIWWFIEQNDVYRVHLKSQNVGWCSWVNVLFYKKYIAFMNTMYTLRANSLKRIHTFRVVHPCNFINIVS